MKRFMLNPLIFSIINIFILHLVADEEVSRRNYMIVVKKYNLTGSKNVIALATINSNGDGHKIFPNVSAYIKILSPIKKAFGRARYRLSSNKCNLCHLMVDHTFNVCQLLSGARMPKMVEKFFEDLNENGFFPKKCPVNEGEYNFRNIMFKGKSLPQYMPPGLFSGHMMFSEDIQMKKILVELVFLGEIVKKG